jgi:hypothetical protein
MWVYLNWALGLRACGCRPIWLEGTDPRTPVHQARELVAALKSRLEPYGLADCLAVCSRSGEPLSDDVTGGCMGLDEAAKADLLLNLRYDLGPEVVGCFPRTALLDIDPGLLQIWISEGQLRVAEHDLYFTIGETVGQPGARFPDAGRTWLYTRPCVALDWWLPRCAEEVARFTTVSHWYAPIEWVVHGDDSYANDKRSGFLPFLDLPQSTPQPLELALCFGTDERENIKASEKQERRALEARGWRVRHTYDVASTPWDYQSYIQASRGEFSCAKPSCVRLQNAWISDRTLCFLASGKPAVVQHTGPSRFLPETAGMFRFRDSDGAIQCLNAASADYEHQCGLARALAEEYFDAHAVVEHLLERALT